jgi:glycosyltransferase involved in cell wall biosynthesis
VVDDNPAALAVLNGPSRVPVEVLHERRGPGDNDGPTRLAALRNIGVRRAGQQYIAFLDDDNAWEPHHLESLWSAIRASGADIAHSQRRLFEADGRPYTREEFPWGRDALTRRAIYAYCLEAGIMSPRSDIVRDRLEMRFTWVDLGEWLFPPSFLEQHPFETQYDAWEWFNITVEDKDLPRAIFQSGLRVVATEEPTLHYYLGGYTNTFEGNGVVWRNPQGDQLGTWERGA